MNESRRLVELLRRAFSRAPVPVHVIAEDDLTPEGALVRDFFAGKQWTEISLCSLQKEYAGDGSACLWFMTPEAAAYYLPAYLEICVCNFHAADMIPVNAVLRLREASEGLLTNISRGINGLSEQENVAIANVLRFIAEKEGSSAFESDAAAALRLRWKDFLRPSDGGRAEG